jgi:uncharacterized protein (DUF488 family)
MDPINDARPPQLFTVGHSNHSRDVFLGLLKQHGIEVLADVRSSPYSAYVTHFAREELEQALKQAGIKYVFLGKELGGRPDGSDYYDTDGHVLYWRLSESPVFLAGIERLELGVRRHRVAMMCSEENPAVCHRQLLVARVIARRGIAVTHIRGDGELQADIPAFEQGTLFDFPEDSPWKSLRSVLPRKTQPSSSESSDETESSDSSTCD